MCNYNYKDVASDYDNLLKQYKWKAPQVLYNNLSKYIQANTRLLDIGVGTGISSERFHQHQVELYGIDNSLEMLAICKAKNVFKEVLLMDVLKDKMPFPKATFDYVICSGLFHFFSTLDNIFTKITRVLKRDGYLAFTIIENHQNEIQYSTESTHGVNVYQHSKDYIKSLTNQYGFTTLHEQYFSALKNLNTKETLEYKLIVLKNEQLHA